MPPSIDMRGEHRTPDVVAQPWATAPAALAGMRSRSELSGLRLLAHHALDGRGDGQQVVGSGSFAYVAHYGSSDAALSVIDATDPAEPVLVAQSRRPDGVHRHKVQVSGDLVVQNGESLRAEPVTDPPTGIVTYRHPSAGVLEPLGSYPMPARGVHRMSLRDGRHLHAASYLADSPRRGYAILDLLDPARPAVAGTWAMPGPEEAGWAPAWPGARMQVHGVIADGARAYVSCTDAGFAILDISEVAHPTMVSTVRWPAERGGYVHTVLPLPDRELLVAVEEATGDPARDPLKRIWLVDNRDERAPRVIAPLPVPTPSRRSPWAGYRDAPLRFGPHNVHENVAGSFVSDRLVVATYYNAGLRVYDIADPGRPVEVGHFVPPPFGSQPAAQLNDLFVTASGTIYVTDRRTAGLYILELDI